MKSDKEGNVRVAAFSEQISELQDLTEMAVAIKILAQDVEIKMLGHSGPHGEDKKEQVYDTSSPLSLISGMRNYTRLTRKSLQDISDSLHRIDQELRGVGMEQPMDEDDDVGPGATVPPSFYSTRSQ